MDTSGTQDGKAYTTRPKRDRTAINRDEDTPKFEALYEEIITTLLRNPYGEPFSTAVTDEIAPGYSDVITHPMDLGTVLSNIKDGVYSAKTTGSDNASLENFTKDVRLVFENCRKYNPEGNWVREWGDSLCAIFDNYITKKIIPKMKKIDIGDRNAREKISNKGKMSIGVKKSYVRALDEESLEMHETSSSKLNISSKKAEKQSSSPISSLYEFQKMKIIDEKSTLSEKRDRMHCIQMAKDLLQQTRLPLHIAFFTISSLGSICNATGFHTQKYIYPLGYRSSYARMISLDKLGRPIGMSRSSSNSSAKKKRPLSITPLVPLAPPSKVIIHYNCTISGNIGSADFCVYMMDMLLGRGSTPLLACQAADDAIGTTVQMVLWRLQRCKAVLNLLCCHPDIGAFLEEVNASEAPGYASTIRRPMYMRLVDERLKDGSYLNEFAFAADVRLVFTNARRYNAEGSSLWHAAQTLSKEFERLFLTWVISPKVRAGANIPLFGATSPPTGPWDAWEVLRYFDAVPGCAKCARTNPIQLPINLSQREMLNWEHEAELEESKLPYCKCCEDRWHSSCLPRGIELTQDKDFSSSDNLPSYNFLCPRCIESAEVLLLSMNKAKKGGSDGGKLAWRATSERLLPVGFYEEGPGRPEWRDSSQRLYLTPSGAVIAGLRTAQNVANTYATRLEEDLAPNRSLSGPEDLQPSSHYLAVFGLKPKKNLDVFYSVKSDAFIPDDGFFGLSRPEIRCRLEGLPGVEELNMYGYERSKIIFERQIAPVNTEQRYGRDAASAEEALREAIIEERGFWREYRLIASTGNNFISSETTLTSEDAPILVPPTPLVGELSTSGPLIEKLLFAWEYIATFNSELGCIPVPIDRAISGTLLRTADLKNFSYDPLLPLPDTLLFDEACIVLTKVLLLEIQHLGGQGFIPGVLTAKPVRDILALKPMNVFTWPEHAAHCLPALCARRRHVMLPATDICRIITQAPKGHLLRCADILCLLMIHPLIGPFMDPVDPHIIAGYSAAVSVPMDIHHIRVRLWGGRNIPRYAAHREFANDVRLIWANARSFHRRGTPIRSSAELLSSLFERLYRTHILNVEESIVRDSARIDDVSALLADRHTARDLEKAARLKAEAAELAAAEAQALSASMPPKVVSKAALALRASRAAKAAAAAAEIAEKAAKAATVWEGGGDNDTDTDDKGGNDPTENEDQYDSAEEKSESLNEKNTGNNDANSDSEIQEEKIVGVEFVHPAFGIRKVPTKCQGAVLSDSEYCHPAFFGRLRHLPLVEEYSSEMANLEKVIAILRQRNPWEWTASERVYILSTLAEEASQTEVGRVILANRGGIPLSEPESEANLGQLEYPEDVSLREPPLTDFDEVDDAISKSNLLCSICLGRDGDYHDWVELPEKLANHPEIELQRGALLSEGKPMWQNHLKPFKIYSNSETTDTMKTSTKYAIKPVAHRACCQAIWRARWLSLQEERRMRAYENAQMKPQISYPTVSTTPVESFSEETLPESSRNGQEIMGEDEVKSLREGLEIRKLLRTQPLGRDHYGNQYWHVFKDTYQLLVRQHGTRWGIYKGTYALQRLIASCKPNLYPCELALRTRICSAMDVWGIEGMLESNVAADTTTLARRKESEIWRRVEIRQSQFLNDTVKAWQARRAPGAPPLPAPAALAAQQLVAARVLEKRLAEYMCVHSSDRQAALASVPETDSLRKERTKWHKDWSEQGQDYHPEKGWLRLDTKSIMKELSAETTATRMIFDPKVLSTASLSPFENSHDRLMISSSRIDPELDSNWLLQYGSNIEPRLWKDISTAARGAGVSITSISSSCQSQTTDILGCSWRWITNECVNQAETEVKNLTKAEESALCVVNDELHQKIPRKLEGETSDFSPIKRVKIEGQENDSSSRQGGMVSQIRTFFEPSSTTIPIASAMVRLKVEMISLSLCLPQTWEEKVTHVEAVSLNTGSIREDPYQRPTLSSSRRIIADQKQLKEEKYDGQVLNEPGTTLQALSADLVEWREKVRKADTCSALVDLAEQLDVSLPRDRGWLAAWFVAAPLALRDSSNSSTVGAVAARIYTLDRALQWEEIPFNTDRNGQRLYPQQLPRHHLSYNQCTLHPLCTEIHAHPGRCVLARNGFSRVGPPLVHTTSPPPAQMTPVYLPVTPMTISTGGSSVLLKDQGKPGDSTASSPWPKQDIVPQGPYSM